jgi:hypothetical protein
MSWIAEVSEFFDLPGYHLSKAELAWLSTILTSAGLSFLNSFVLGNFIEEVFFFFFLPLFLLF